MTLRPPAAVDELSDGLLRHLRARSTVYAVIARAPLAKLEKYRAKRGTGHDGGPDEPDLPGRRVPK